MAVLVVMLVMVQEVEEVEEVERRTPGGHKAKEAGAHAGVHVDIDGRVPREMVPVVGLLVEPRVADMRPRHAGGGVAVCSDTVPDDA